MDGRLKVVEGLQFFSHTHTHTQTSLLLRSSKVSPPLALSMGSDLAGDPGLSPSPASSPATIKF